ncbi:MAG: hypothetical protein IJU37_00695 [Desulfovibrio sp.]|nr:hypothetical protein [Desulfovibrio sp.]
MERRPGRQGWRQPRSGASRNRACGEATSHPAQDVPGRGMPVDALIGGLGGM